MMKEEKRMNLQTYFLLLLLIFDLFYIVGIVLILWVPKMNLSEIISYQKSERIKTLGP